MWSERIGQQIDDCKCSNTRPSQSSSSLPCKRGHEVYLFRRCILGPQKGQSCRSLLIYVWANPGSWCLHSMAVSTCSMMHSITFLQCELFSLTPELRFSDAIEDWLPCSVGLGPKPIRRSGMSEMAAVRATCYQIKHWSVWAKIRWFRGRPERSDGIWAPAVPWTVASSPSWCLAALDLGLRRPEGWHLLVTWREGPPNKATSVAKILELLEQHQVVFYSLSALLCFLALASFFSGRIEDLFRDIYTPVLPLRALLIRASASKHVLEAWETHCWDCWGIFVDANECVIHSITMLADNLHYVEV